MLCRICAVLSALVLSSGIVQAADDKEGLDFFEKHIRPVLVSKCYECHSASSKEPKGGLLLDTRDGIRRGGESGESVVPNSADDSIILEALRYEGLEMPPDEQLSDNVIAKFEQWIAMGAPDPRDGKSALIKREINFEEAREFWAFRPISNPDVPKAGNWAETEIDQFIDARRTSRGLKPVADAEAQVLVRRVYFDLTGLPPTPEQAAEFTAAATKDAKAALTNLVDTLLASPRFGERWGRHWLDVVRYAESTGMERNATYPHAWRYRDYVIAAFNQDKPFDQFIREQVAGDLLDAESGEQKKEQHIATAFLALGPKSLNDNNKEKFAMDVVDEQIDVTTRAFIGLTASCARCHDHKFDPIPQKEYYGLAGIFRSTDTFYGTDRQQGNRNPGRLLAYENGSFKAVSLAGGGKGNKNAIQKRLKGAQVRLKRLEAQLNKNPNNKKVQNQKAAIERQIAQIQKQLRQQKKNGGAGQPPSKNAELIMAVQDGSNPGDTQLRVRGEPNDRGDTIARGFLTIGSVGHVPEIDASKSGRLALADWLVQKDNPLTARVAVNRIWQHLFGRGIVRTVDNFGANGDRPTHPELLDWLAGRFIEDGWSVKKAVRRIMLSRVYRLGSGRNEAAEESDPANSYLWRANHRRLEAEAIRDAILAASGQLDLEPAQASPVSKAGNGIVGRNLQPAVFAEASTKRSVYLPIVRGAVPEILKVFDFPEPSIISGRRDVTTVATQALYLMNSDFVIDQSMKLARQLLDEDQMTDKGRIERTYRLTLARSPSQEELESALKFIEETATSLSEGETERSPEDMATIKAWAGLAQALYGTAEFRYVE